MVPDMPIGWLISGPQLGFLSFLVLFGAAAGGMVLAANYPRPGPLRAVVQLISRATTIVAVLAALMLAFLTTSLKTSFDAADQDVRRFSVQLIELDRTLRRAGPEAEPVRETLFRYTTRVMKDIWPKSHPNLRPEDTTATHLLEVLEDQVDRLPPGGSYIQADARQALRAAQQARLELDARSGGSMSPWLLGFLEFWLALTFAGLGMAAPRTPLAVTALFLFAVAISGAIFLASEYDYPFDGMIVISTEPLEAALFAMTE